MKRAPGMGTSAPPLPIQLTRKSPIRATTSIPSKTIWRNLMEESTTAAKTAMRMMTMLMSTRDSVEIQP